MYVHDGCVIESKQECAYMMKWDACPITLVASGPSSSLKHNLIVISYTFFLFSNAQNMMCDMSDGPFYAYDSNDQ